ncbi:MAG: dCTP deaminase, partial [Phaeodactylibacter sp.]|nr:dCTP deaminase [Phaeodactylibacter sp.]
MILSDKKILEGIEQGEIVIEPFQRHCLGTNSYDVHLSKWLAIYKDHVLDARRHNPIEYLEIPESGFI